MLTSLIFSNLEVRVLCEGDRSHRIDKMGLGTNTHSPLLSMVALEDIRPSTSLCPPPLERSSLTPLPLVQT